MTLFEFTLLLTTLAAAPQVEVSTLSGTDHTGELTAIDDAALTLNKQGEVVQLPLPDLLAVRFTSEPPPARVRRGLAQVSLRDGSRFHTAAATASGRQAAFAGGPLGEFNIPRTALLSLRFDSDRSLDTAWRKLHQRRRKRDLLVIKKKGDVAVLDFLEGIVGSVGNEEIRFLLDGDEIPVPRTKVFGVIYADSQTGAAKPLCNVSLHNSSRLLVGRLRWTGSSATATLAAGGEVKIPAAAIREFDFSLGKVRYLSQMEHREYVLIDSLGEKSKTVLSLFDYRKDENLNGEPLRLDDKTYKRGLCIHSKTRLVYRLNTNYRRFKAVAGIDFAVARENLGSVHLVISDRDRKKVLFEADVRGTDKPRAIDVDVSQVRDLEILVDFLQDNLGNPDLGISDWLDLADARVTK